MDAFQESRQGEDISEDEIKDLEDGIQKLTDKYVAEIDKAVDAKSDEILDSIRQWEGAHTACGYCASFHLQVGGEQD